MTVRSTMTASITGIALALTFGLMAGCSAISEIQDVVPDVAVDEDGGSVTIEDDDGGSITVDTSVDGEIPEWFPSELPLPDTYTVVSASEVGNGDESLKMVGITSSDDFDSVVETIDEGLATSGLVPETRETGVLGDMNTAMFSVDVAGETWMINLIDHGSEGELEIMYAKGTAD